MDERRRYQRVPYFRPLQVTVMPDGPVVLGNSFDISRGGLGLVVTASLQRGQSVSVQWQVEDERRQQVPVRVLGKIAYSRADEGGNYIGIEFLEDVRESTQPALARMLNNL